MKTREESIEINISCDMADCDSEARYSTEHGPYMDGWRTLNVIVYNMYEETDYGSNTMHVCSSCMIKLSTVKDIHTHMR